MAAIRNQSIRQIRKRNGRWIAFQWFRCHKHNAAPSIEESQGDWLIYSSFSIQKNPIVSLYGFPFFSGRHRWTGRFEAHLWDKNGWNQSQNKKGKQGWSLSFLNFNILFRSIFSDCAIYGEEQFILVLMMMRRLQLVLMILLRSSTGHKPLFSISQSGPIFNFFFFLISSSSHFQKSLLVSLVTGKRVPKWDQRNGRTELRGIHWIY